MNKIRYDIDGGKIVSVFGKLYPGIEDMYLITPGYGSEYDGDFIVLKNNPKMYTDVQIKELLDNEEAFIIGNMFDKEFPIKEMIYGTKRIKG